MQKERHQEASAPSHIMCFSCPSWWCSCHQPGLLCKKGCNKTKLVLSHFMCSGCVLLVAVPAVTDVKCTKTTAPIKHVSCHNKKHSNQVSGELGGHLECSRLQSSQLSDADGQEWHHEGCHTATQAATLQCSPELTLTCSAYRGAEWPAAAAAYCMSWVICCIASGGRSGACVGCGPSGAALRRRRVPARTVGTQVVRQQDRGEDWQWWCCRARGPFQRLRWKPQGAASGFCSIPRRSLPSHKVCN